MDILKILKSCNFVMKTLNMYCNTLIAILCNPHHLNKKVVEVGLDFLFNSSYVTKDITFYYILMRNL